MKLDLEPYRKEVLVSREPRVRLSVIDIAPEVPRRTLVLVHGFSGRAAQWEHQLRTFAEENRVLAMDLRGHGLSDAPETSYSMEEILSDIESVLEALRITEKVVLLGHSFGGAIASSFAVAHPERVDKLVLISAASDFTLRRFYRLAFKLPASLVEFIRRLLPQNLIYPSAHVLKRFYANNLRLWNGRIVLPRVPVPTLVIMGHRDLAFPQAAYEAVAKLIPGAQTVVVPVSAHLVMLERPDAVNRAIQRFLGEAPLSWREPRPEQRLEVRRPWLKHYELGVPHTLLLPNQPLHRYLERSASRYPQRTATIFYGSRMSYEELQRRAVRFANALIDLGVKQGDRIMILLPNMPQCVIAYYGALKAGAIVVLSNPLYAEGELQRQLRDCGAETLVTLSDFYPMARRTRERTDLQRIILTHIIDYLPLHRRILFKWTRQARERPIVDWRGDVGTYNLLDLLKGYPADPAAIEVRPEDVAVIQYTGGTTDLPKGTMLTHRNLVANIVQIRHWITDVREGREVFLAVLPFSHVYGMTACMNLAISLASALILLPTFVTREVLEHIRAYRPTLFPGVPTMYLAINNYPGVRKFGLSSIRACVSGAAPLPIEVQEAFEKLTRGKLVEGYGLTEASPVTHANPLNGLRKTGSIGIPLPSTEAKIVDLERGVELPPGGIGELVVRGPQIMQGYWNRPEETREVLRDGWLYTGDIASLDEDGYFRVIDRKKDMIIAGRYNVYPRDVEEVLYEHPQVFEAAVVGIPPWDENQAIKAYVVLKEGHQASAEEIIAFCRSRLEPQAVPQIVEFRETLPKTLVGKVARRQLVEGEQERLAAD